MENEPSELFGVLLQILPQISESVDFTLLASAVDDIYERETAIYERNFAMTELSSSLENAISGSVQSAAADAHYSLYYYIKKFKHQIGMTPHKFNIQCRVRKAQRMIEGGDMPADIALDLGFYDQSHFTKCFKRIVGLTPIEYRAAIKKIVHL